MSALRDALERLRNLMKRVRAPRGIGINVETYDNNTFEVSVVPYAPNSGKLTNQDVHKIASEIERLLNKLQYTIKDVRTGEGDHEEGPDLEYQFLIEIPVWSAVLFYDGYAVDALYEGTEEKAQQRVKDLEGRTQFDVVKGVQPEGKARVASMRAASAERVAGRYRLKAAMLKVPRDRGALKALLKDFWQYGTDDGSYSELNDVLNTALNQGVLRDDPLRYDDFVDAVAALENIAKLEESAYNEGTRWSKRHLKPLMDAL